MHGYSRWDQKLAKDTRHSVRVFSISVLLLKDTRHSVRNWLHPFKVWAPPHKQFFNVMGRSLMTRAKYVTIIVAVAVPGLRRRRPGDGRRRRRLRRRRHLVFARLPL